MIKIYKFNHIFNTTTYFLIVRDPHIFIHIINSLLNLNIFSILFIPLICIISLFLIYMFLSDIIKFVIYLVNLLLRHSVIYCDTDNSVAYRVFTAVPKVLITPVIVSHRMMRDIFSPVDLNGKYFRVPFTDHLPATGNSKGDSWYNDPFFIIGSVIYIGGIYYFFGSAIAAFIGSYFSEAKTVVHNNTMNASHNHSGENKTIINYQTFYNNYPVCNGSHYDNMRYDQLHKVYMKLQERVTALERFCYNNTNQALIDRDRIIDIVRMDKTIFHLTKNGHYLFPQENIPFVEYIKLKSAAVNPDTPEASINRVVFWQSYYNSCTPYRCNIRGFAAYPQTYFYFITKSLGHPIPFLHP